MISSMVSRWRVSALWSWSQQCRITLYVLLCFEYCGYGLKESRCVATDIAKSRQCHQQPECTHRVTMLLLLNVTSHTGLPAAQAPPLSKTSLSSLQAFAPYICCTEADAACLLCMLYCKQMVHLFLAHSWPTEAVAVDTFCASKNCQVDQLMSL